MLESVDHVLLTRFNVPTPGYESLVRASDGWLEKRIVLFEKYCLPSVRNQGDRRFRWLVYFDPESPEWFIKRVREANGDGIFTPMFRSAISRQDLLEDLRTAVGSPGRYLLTTNLDNDDGLAADFTARLRGAPSAGAASGGATPGERSTALFLSNGLIRSGQVLYRNQDPDNAFCSVLSSWDSPETCWADWHNRLGQSMPVVRLAGRPAWLQVVHGSNVSNRIHGFRVPPAAFRSLFPSLLDDLAEPTKAQLIRDAAVLAPAREARDLARGLAKSLLLKTSGPDGADRLRAWAVRHSIRPVSPGKG